MSLAPPYALIRQAFLDGQIIPFLGAGASLGARVPAGASDSASTRVRIFAKRCRADGSPRELVRFSPYGTERSGEGRAIFLRASWTAISSQSVAHNLRSSVRYPIHPSISGIFEQAAARRDNEL